MQAFERHFTAANRWALILLLAAMSVIIFVNVALRYLTNHSLEWAEEVSRHMMIWLTFLGAGPVLRYGGHIAVENLQDALPGRGAVVVRAIVAALLFAFLERSSSTLQFIDVPTEIYVIMQGSIVLSVVVAYEAVRRIAATQAERAVRRATDRTPA